MPKACVLGPIHREFCIKKKKEKEAIKKPRKNIKRGAGPVVQAVGALCS